MIDAKELRIGNWVSQLGKPCQIDLGVLFHLAQGGHAVEGFNPIPLTPELLEKLSIYTSASGLLGIITVGDLDFFIAFAGDTCIVTVERKHYPLHKFTNMHLHQLQNLIFALTGQELEITL